MELTNRDIRLLMFALGCFLGQCSVECAKGTMTQEEFELRQKKVIELDEKLQAMMTKRGGNVT